jgi:hypothetical protein
MLSFLTKKGPILSEGNSFVKAEMASDNVSGPEFVAVSYACA